MIFLFGTLAKAQLSEKVTLYGPQTFAIYPQTFEKVAIWSINPLKWSINALKTLFLALNYVFWTQNGLYFNIEPNIR
jgi:hypothetical protein